MKCCQMWPADGAHAQTDANKRTNMEKPTAWTQEYKMSKMLSWGILTWRNEMFFQGTLQRHNFISSMATVFWTVTLEAVHITC